MSIVTIVSLTACNNIFKRLVRLDALRHIFKVRAHAHFQHAPTWIIHEITIKCGIHGIHNEYWDPSIIDTDALGVD